MTTRTHKNALQSVQNKKRTIFAQLHFSRALVLSLITCVVIFVAMLPVSEMLTSMLLCAVDVPEEGWTFLKSLARIFLFLIAGAFGVMVYSRATDED